MAKKKIVPKFKKEVVRPARFYPYGKDGEQMTVDIDFSRIKHWADTAKIMFEEGLMIPAPYEHHVDAVPVRSAEELPKTFKNAGFWTGFQLEKDGTLSFDFNPSSPEDAEAAKKQMVSLRAIDWNGESDVITHIALTERPIFEKQSPFVENGVALALSMSEPYETEEFPDKNENGLAKACSVMKELGIELPQLTTPEEFVNAVVIAGTAVLSMQKKQKQEGGATEDRLTKAPAGAKAQKPSPIAMSKSPELEFAAKLLAEKGITQEDGSPFTADSLSVAFKAAEQPPVQLSAQQQARVDFASTQYRNALKDRIEKLVNRKVVSPDSAKSELAPRLQTVELQFSADGKPEKSDLEILIDSFEKLSDGNALSGKTSKQVFQDSISFSGKKFTLGTGLETHELDEGPEEVTEERAAEVAKSVAALLR